MATLDTKELKGSPQLVTPPIDDKIPQKKYEWGKDRGTVEETKDSVRAGMKQPPPASPPTLTDMRKPAERGFASGLEYGLRTSDSLRGSPRPDDQSTPFQIGDAALPRRTGEDGYQMARQMAEGTSDSIRGGFWSRDSGSTKGSDIKAAAEGSGSYVRGAGQEMVEKAKSAPAEIQDRSRQTYEELKARERRAVSEIESKVRPQIEKVEGYVEAVPEKVKGAAGEAVNRIDDAAHKIKEAVTGENEPQKRTDDSIQNAKEKAIQAEAATAKPILDKAHSHEESVLERVENVVSSAEDAASHVAGAVSAKVGEIRADWRKQQEEQLASDTARPMEERISHAKRAAEERLEQTKKEHEKSGHVEWLSETKPVEFAREARDKVAEVTGINKARKVIGEKSHEFADEVREAKHTYGIALGRAKDAAVGKVHAAKEYIEDTGEWMKKGIDIAEGKIEHMFGIHIPRRTEGAEPQHYAYDKWSHDPSLSASARDAAKEQGEYYGNVMKEGAERLSAKTTSDPSEKANHLQRAESAKVNQEAAVNARDQQMANIKQQQQSMFGRLKSGLSRFLGFEKSSRSRPDE